MEQLPPINYQGPSQISQEEFDREVSAAHAKCIKMQFIGFGVMISGLLSGLVVGYLLHADNPSARNESPADFVWISLLFFGGLGGVYIKRASALFRKRVRDLKVQMRSIEQQSKREQYLRNLRTATIWIFVAGAIGIFIALLLSHKPKWQTEALRDIPTFGFLMFLFYLVARNYHNTPQK